jgi:hypothetical protein
MQRRRIFSATLLILPTALCVYLGSTRPSLALGSATSCAQFMAPKRSVAGKMVGQDRCLMIDRGIVDPARKLHRIDMGFTGTLSGYVVKQGPRESHFTSVPDYLFTQAGNHGPWFHGILTYTAEKGTSVTLTYPEEGWNGKVFVMVHGMEGTISKGMHPWDKYFSPEKPLSVNKYERALLEKGYAVATTRRNADGTIGDFSAVLDDGTVFTDLNVSVVPELILDETRAVDSLLKQQTGHKPTQNYWYGHSAGSYMGLSANYLIQSDPKVNKDADDHDIISGFIDDDPGFGWFIPVLRKNGKDVLYQTAEEKAQFVKTILIAHEMNPDARSYLDVGEVDVNNFPEGITPRGLTNKRNIARIAQEKGIDHLRMYEVRGVSHIGGESLPNGKDGEIEILNLSRIEDGIYDLLDNWVDKGVAPPPTRSDVKELGLGGEALDPPENACPLGQYYPFPHAHTQGSVTGFAPYDGKSLEPLDGRGVFVDMNKSGVRDRVETVTEAWRRLGLLKPGESFSREKYVGCYQSATAKLRKENFITEKVEAKYLEDAQKAELPDQ